MEEFQAIVAVQTPDTRDGPPVAYCPEVPWLKATRVGIQRLCRPPKGNFSGSRPTGVPEIKGRVMTATTTTVMSAASRARGARKRRAEAPSRA